MLKKKLIACLVGGAVGVVLAYGCGGNVAPAQAQLAAITAGCKVSLDLVRDSGAAGAIDEVEDGCRTSLKAWEKASK